MCLLARCCERRAEAGVDTAKSSTTGAVRREKEDVEKLIMCYSVKEIRDELRLNDALVSGVKEDLARRLGSIFQMTDE